MERNRGWIKVLSLLLLTSCVSFETPPLPDLDTKNFSDRDILQKQRELDLKIQERNKDVTKNT
jgi:hypothetical protein